MGFSKIYSNLCPGALELLKAKSAGDAEGNGYPRLVFAFDVGNHPIEAFMDEVSEILVRHGEEHGGASAGPASGERAVYDEARKLIVLAEIEVERDISFAGSAGRTPLFARERHGGWVVKRGGLCGRGSEAGVPIAPGKAECPNEGVG